MTDSMSIVPAAAVPPAALWAAFNAAFADYLIGPPQLPEAQWPAFLRRQGVELAFSRVALQGEHEVQAFALMGRFSDRFTLRTRVATMGARRETRGTGIAPRLLEQVITEARERGDAALELEVFAQNTVALRLYRAHGFEPVCELYGYESAAVSPEDWPPTQPPYQVTLEGAAAWLRAHAAPDLPFQVSPPALDANATPPLVAWRAGDAQLVFTARDAAHVSIASLFDASAAQADAQLLLRALRGQYPAATLRVPQLQRLDLGGRALEAVGFQRLPLYQLLMRHTLT